MNDTYDIEPPCEPGCTTALHFILITWMVLEELMFVLECYHNRFQGLDITLAMTDNRYIDTSGQNVYNICSCIPGE